VAKLKNNQINTLTGAIRDDLIVSDDPNSIVKSLQIPQDRMEILFQHILPSGNLIITKENIKSDLLTGLQNLRTSLNNLNYVKKRNGVMLTVMLMEKVLQFVNILATETYTESYYQNVYGIFDNQYTINYLNDGSTTGRIRLLSKFPVIEKIFKSMEPLLYSCGNKYIDFNVEDFFNSAIDNMICNIGNMDNADVEKKGYEMFNDITKILTTLFPNGSDIDALPEENQNFLKFIIMLRDMKVEEASIKGTSTVFTLLDNFLPVILKIDQYFNTQPHLKPYISSIQLLYLHLNELGQKYLIDKARNSDSDYNDYLKHKQLTKELTNRNNHWIPSYLYYAPTVDIKQTLIGSEWVKNWNILLSYVAKEVFIDSNNFLDIVLRDNILFVENKYFDNNQTMDYQTYNLNKKTMALSLYNNFSALNETMLIKNAIGVSKGRRLGWLDSVGDAFQSVTGAVNSLLSCDICEGAGNYTRSLIKTFTKTGLTIISGGLYQNIAGCGKSMQGLFKNSLSMKDELLKTNKNQALINSLTNDMNKGYGYLLGNCTTADTQIILSPLVDILSGQGLLGNLTKMIDQFLGSPTDDLALELAKQLNNTLTKIDYWYSKNIAVNQFANGFLGKTFTELLNNWFLNFRRMLSGGQSFTEANILNRIHNQQLNMFLLDISNEEYNPSLNDFPKCYNNKDQLVTGNGITIPVIFLAVIISFSLVEKSKCFSPLLGMLKPLAEMKKNYNFKNNAMTDFKNLYQYAIKNNFGSYALIQIAMNSILFNYLDTQLKNECSNYNLNKDLVSSKIALDVAFIGWNLIIFKAIKQAIRMMPNKEKHTHKTRLQYLDYIINFALVTAHTGLDITMAVDLNNQLPKVYKQ